MDNKILVTRSSMPSVEEYIDEIRSIWESHWFCSYSPLSAKTTSLAICSVPPEKG